MNWIRKYALYFAWVISLIGLLISVYYGEVLNLEPCRLCWYQRIGLFPLALFLGIACYKSNRNLALYTLPLVAFGGIFAFYQTLIQIFPKLHSPVLCGSSTHCTLPAIPPILCLLAFVLIALFIILSEKNQKD